MEQVARVDRRQAGWDGLSIVLMDDEGIARVNRQCLDRARPTDVLSFRYESGFGTESRSHGEVILNVERALLEGPRHGSASSELALYLAHGCNHLAGENDATGKGRRRMRSREMRWLKRIVETTAISQLLR